MEALVLSGTSVFYVGYHGSFDRMAAAALRKVTQTHSDVRAILVLAYHPAEQAIQLPDGFDGSFYPPLKNTPANTRW